MIGQGYTGFVPISVNHYVWCFGRKLRFAQYDFALEGQVMAVGGNKQAAIASGINVDRVIILVYIYDGIVTAIAAIIFMSRLSSGQPSRRRGVCI